MAKEQDLILRLYVRGLSEILENIFFDLPLQTLLKCREVHPHWKDIIDDLFNSSSRKCKKLEKKAWLSHSPLKSAVEIPHLPRCHDLQFDIQSDSQIIVFGCVSSSKRNGIYKGWIQIFDAKTLVPGSTVDFLPVLENVGELSDAIKIFIHKSSIVVVVRSFCGIFQGPQTTAYMVFNRIKPYSLKRFYHHSSICKYPPSVYLPLQVALRPRIFADLLLVPLHPYHSDNWSGIICSQLHLEEKVTSPIECFVKESEGPALEIFAIEDDKFLILNCDSISLYSLTEKSPIWSLKSDSVDSLEYTQEYIITIKLLQSELIGYVKIYNIADCSLYKSIFVDTNIWVTSNVQICSGRMALTGWEPEIIVYDLESGDTIQRFGQKDGLKSPGNYKLEKNRIIVVDEGKLKSFRFWI